MILRRLGSINRSQKGFTFIEMIVAIAISSAIGGGLLLSIYQTSSYEAMDKARMICVKQLENAIHYIVQDAQMAQKVTLAGDDDNFPLILSWTEWDVTSPEYKHVVTYTLKGSGSSELERQHLTYDVSGTETKNELNVVARHIEPNSAKTNCGYVGGVLSFGLTATITGFPEEISETRDVEIVRRTNW
jgi:prepilin-type N-terminal cleavage/methylation domain-containing protein